MSDTPHKPTPEGDTVALNLAAFAPGQKQKQAPSTPPEEEGMTMIIGKAAAEVVQANAAKPSSAPSPSKELLGAVAYSYAKGVYRSEDIARKMGNDPKYSEAAGDHLPDANAIRRFRRLNRDSIMETLSKVFRRQRKKATAETLGQTLPGAEPSVPPPAPAPSAASSVRRSDNEPGETTILSRKDAESHLNKAAWIDNMSKDD
jgi:hypothetical protein